MKKEIDTIAKVIKDVHDERCSLLLAEIRVMGIQHGIAFNPKLILNMTPEQLDTIDTFQNKNRGFKDTNIPLENIED